MLSGRNPFCMTDIAENLKTMKMHEFIYINIFHKAERTEGRWIMSECLIVNKKMCGTSFYC